MLRLTLPTRVRAARPSTDGGKFLAVSEVALITISTEFAMKWCRPLRAWMDAAPGCATRCDGCVPRGPSGTRDAELSITLNLADGSSNGPLTCAISPMPALVAMMGGSPRSCSRADSPGTRRLLGDGARPGGKTGEADGGYLLTVSAIRRSALTRRSARPTRNSLTCCVLKGCFRRTVHRELAFHGSDPPWIPRPRLPPPIDEKSDSC